MTKLLKASLLLATPLLFAYGSSDADSGSSGMPISVGAEITGHLISDSWHTAATATSGTLLSPLAVALTNASGFSYQEDNSSLPNYAFGGRICARTEFSEGFKFMVALGVETGMQDASSYRPYDFDNDTITPAQWTTHTTSTWSNNMVIAPALYVGYDSLYLGVSYDMREFDVTGHPSTLTALNKSGLKDNQVMFGFRGETSYDLDDMDLVVAFEFMTNLGQKADSDLDTYFTDLFKHTGDSLHAETVVVDGDSVINSANANTATTTATRGVVSSTYTNISKASVSIGVALADF